MRMRRQKHLDERLAACGERILSFCEEIPDARVHPEGPPISLSELFGNDRPVSLEIGCGKGKFICESAARYPEQNFIGVENNAHVLLCAAESAIRQNLANVRFLLCGAEYLIRHLPPHSIERIYLNFSCPFPKKGQAGRRLTNPRLIADYRELLIPGAAVWQKTDDADFFAYSIEQFQKGGFELRHICDDLHHSDFVGNIETEYEAKFAALGRPIHRLEAFSVRETK